MLSAPALFIAILFGAEPPARAAIPIASPPASKVETPIVDAPTNEPLVEPTPGDETIQSEGDESEPAAIDPVPLPPNAYGAPSPPSYLPSYDLKVRLDTAARVATATQTVRWTNPGPAPTDHLEFHVYARYRPDPMQLRVYERTIESFRLEPRTAIDKEGRRINVRTARSGEAPLKFSFDAKIDTLMCVELPHQVEPGKTVEVTFEYEISIPPTQGRLGQYRGVTSMLNWYPLVAYYGEKGWDAPPFVGWHQPWLNEAGDYTVKLTLPASEEVASSAHITGVEPAEPGWKTVKLAGRGIRDLSITASKLYETHETTAAGVTVRVLAVPEHRFYARKVLESAAEAIEQYSRWFGPFPHPTFTIAESYFGWNGNETGGMVLIDYRVFDAPAAGHVYVDHLISHEVCHQWWYGTVGTDGFRETWMDEAFVSHFNEIRMRAKHGRDARIIDYPKCIEWMPNVPYHTLMRSGYYLFRYRGGKGNVLAPLPEIGHVHNLFFLAYDRGSKVVSMIHQRMGDERFFAFLRMIYAKYGFRVLFFADFQRELEAFTGQEWGQFFDDWLRSPKIADWKIEKVRSTPSDGGHETTVVLKQKAQLDEPIDLEIEAGGQTITTPIVPDADEYEVDGTVVKKTGPREWTVTARTSAPPDQVVADPRDQILDANMVNNRWKKEPPITFTPIYTPLDEVAITRPLDRPSFRWGPGVDMDGRFGFRGSLIEPYKYRVSPFVAYDWNVGLTSTGVDAEFYNFPLPNISVGGRYDNTVFAEIPQTPANQGKIFLRWTQIYTSSYLYPNLAYVEAYYRFGDNFYPLLNLRPTPFPGTEQYFDVRAVGLTYHLDTRMPYWNPEKGFALDATAEHGIDVSGPQETFSRVSGQVAAVHRLPDGLGYFSETRLAARLAGGIGGPNSGEHFRFGGPYAFRAQHTPTIIGSEYWLTSLDWRFPVFPEFDARLLDNCANWRSLYASIFSDVGDSFIFNNSQGFDYSVGVGLYAMVTLMSFIENVTMRLELAHSIPRDSSILWFGLYQAF